MGEVKVDRRAVSKAELLAALMVEKKVEKTVAAWGIM